MFKDLTKNNGQARKKITRVLISCCHCNCLLFNIAFPASQAISAFTFQLTRIKNILSYYVLQDKPHFYYIAMEKNGKDIRINANESFEVTS